MDKQTSGGGDKKQTEIRVGNETDVKTDVHRVDEHIKGITDGQMAGQTGRQTDRQMDWKTVGQTNTWIDRRFDKLTSG